MNRPQGTYRRWIWYVWLFIFAAGEAMASSGVEVMLPTETKIATDRIVLGQISEIKGGTEETRRWVSDVDLGPAPGPGRIIWIHEARIQSSLQSHGFAPGIVHIHAQGPVKVLRSYEDLTTRKICDAVRAFIYRSAPWDRNQIKIRSVTCNQPLRLPPGNLDLQVTAPKHTDWIGSIPFKVNVYINRDLADSLSVPATIEVWSNVVVTAKPLGRHQPIGPDDIKIQRMNLARTPRDAILSMEKVIGCRAIRPMAANTILSSKGIEMPPVIRKGDVVQLVAETPLFKVVTRGIAKEKGGTGERIRVMNLRSKKVVYARIVDQSTVRVQF